MTTLKKGRLHVFFSYADGDADTQAMLQAALRAKAEGMSVLIGFMTSPDSDNIKELTSKIDSLAPLIVNNEPIFDLDCALIKKPDLILLDKLAFTNQRICRHKKRYQDVYELLDAGISVYTTVSAANIESLHDTVASVTGISECELIPDSVFDLADQVELIDVEPQELKKRLQENSTNITIEQLTALREIASRRYADRAKRVLGEYRAMTELRTDEHILVCLSSAPSNAKIIWTAARMASAFNSRFTALFIKTPEFATTSAENKKRLRENLKLAEQLGASIETVFGDDIPYKIAEFARLSGITKIVLGRSVLTRKHLWGKSTLTEQLLDYVPDLDVHIIPDKNDSIKYHQPKFKSPICGMSFLTY